MFGEMFSGSDSDLFAHQVAPEDLFGNRMFYLNPRIHFHEIEITVLIDEIFHRARVFIANRCCEFYGAATHFLSNIIINHRGRAFLDDLLVAPLDRAIAFAEMNDAAVTIATDLKLNMVGTNDKLLHIDTAIPEGLLSLSSGRVKSLNQAIDVMSRTHTTPPSPGHCLDHHRVPELLGHFPR